MSIEEMQSYLEYCLQGPSTLLERQEILTNKKAELLDKMKTIQDSILYIDNKQAYYTNVLLGKVPYQSNLISLAEISD